MLRVILVAAAVACSGQTAPPAPPARPAPPAIAVDAGPPADAAPLDQDLPRLAARGLAMFGDIAAAFAQSGEDCAAAAARLTEIARTYRDVIDANARLVREGRGKELQAALAPHRDAFDAAARAIMTSPTMAACAQDPAFAEAFDALVEPS